jgi:DnaK suppressor protein
MKLYQESNMIHLTAGQCAWLQSELQMRQKELATRLTEHHGGLSRAEHAHDVLTQDGDDAPQRAGDRQVDMALSDLETRELAAVNGALERVRSGRFGRCADCGGDIPFDRLKAEPWALRCLACESDAEITQKAPRESRPA